jgi:cellulose synthase/poly-beta-1,6-N-acetylglucosamine synthase-like glycosyltransferase
MAAHNESQRLPEKLQSLRALDYPADRLRFYVADDASTDDTWEVLGRLQAQEPRLVTLRAARNMGKPGNLNRLVERADQDSPDVLVFNDARQPLDAQALRALVAPLLDPEVGGATGDLVLPPQPDGSIKGMGVYWRYETWLRRNEALAGSVVGATGALYAVRRSCFVPFEPELVLDDMLLPLRVVLQGKRFVFAHGALAYDVYSRDLRHEERRKARTLGGVYQAMALEPGLLRPGSGVLVPFLFHKVGRVALPFLLGALAVGNGAALAGLASTGRLLTPRGLVQLALATGQAGFYGGAALADWRQGRGQDPGALAAARTMRSLAASSWRGWRMWRRGEVTAAWKRREMDGL